MVLGLLPAIRGGIGELARTGQHSRFIDGYLTPYARAFDQVRYFSYLKESLEPYRAGRTLPANVRLLPGADWHPWLYTGVMPIRYRREFRDCTVLRVFQVTGVLPAIVAKRLFRTPFVVTYGFWYSKLARSRGSAWLRRAVERVGLAAADAVIVTTPELRRHVASRVARERIHLIPNGVDVARFRPVKPDATSTRNILYVGRLSEEKNLHTLVAAVGKLVDRFDVRLTFVGDGPLRHELEAASAERRIASSFVPVVDHRELPGFFARAHAFVLPSFTEGHPKVLLEAMSCGVPCLASNVSGNRAILTDGETGLLFDPEDAGALATALERVFTQGDLAGGLGERARALILERYDLRVLVGGEIELLRSVARAR